MIFHRKYLCAARKVLVNPLIQTDESFIGEWIEANRGEQNDYPESRMYLTEREENGLLLGENFLCSMESDVMPLNVQMMEIKVKKYLL